MFMIICIVRLLLVKVNDGPRQCLLFDGLERGDTVVVGNLILCESQNSFGLAIANHFTLVTKYPQNKAAREALECFRNELPNVSIKIKKMLYYLLASFTRLQTKT